MSFNNPFSKIDNLAKSESGFIMNFKKLPEIEQEISSNIQKTLTKISSSKKTKAVSQLVDSKAIFLGYGIVNILDSTIPLYGIVYGENNILKGLVVDTSKIISTSYHTEFISNLNVISDQMATIKTQESMLTSTSTEQIKMAKESIISKYKELLQNIDWFLLVDIIYFLYLKFLAKKSLHQNKGKIFGIVNEILHNTIKDIIFNYSSKDKIGPKESKIIMCLIDFLMISQYTNNPKQETLNAIFKMLIQNAKPNEIETIDEVIAKIKELKPTKYNRLDEISYLLAEAQIINITPNALNKLIGEKFGEKYQLFNSNIDSLIAYFISLTYTSELFHIRNVPYRNNIERLEELVLNAKGDILIKPF